MQEVTSAVYFDAAEYRYDSGREGKRGQATFYDDGCCTIARSPAPSG